MSEITLKVPARICFYGDHQDYLGLPVIAGAINRFISVTAKPISEKAFQIHLKDLDKVKTIPLNEALGQIEAGDYFRSGMAVLQQKGFKFLEGYSIEISGNIPLNAGLSSSSALVVAWIRFLVATQKKTAVTSKEIGHWAYEAEVLFFDQPGGLMDQYTVAQQGLLYIETNTGKTERLAGHLGKLAIAESGIKKQTLDVLKNGRVYQERAIAEVQKVNPSFSIQNSEIEDYQKFLQRVPEIYRKHWYAAIYNFDITKKAKALLIQANSDCIALGKLMNAHQKILEACIQNTPAAMTKMMVAANKAGALGTKTIGSGGGGTMVAMVNDDTIKEVIKAFLNSGAKAAYEVELV